jgi:hypothetical protein
MVEASYMQKHAKTHMKYCLQKAPLEIRFLELLRSMLSITLLTTNP